MADVQTKEPTREELAKQNELAHREGREVVVNPQIIQTTFSDTIRQGLPGMINRMVDYNAVSRNCATAAGIPAARAVSQGTRDEDAVIGGTANGFIGITILDPTLVNPTTSALGDGVYAQYTEMGILTKGEIFAACVLACAAGDPAYFVAADGTLTNLNTQIAIGGARWKYTRATPGDLNVLQLGIQR